MYLDFLIEVKEAGDYWSVLPRELAQWWKDRSNHQAACPSAMAQAVLLNDCLQIYPEISH
jgi:hypothetical protein